MCAQLTKNSSGDVAGHYYTAPGNTPLERYNNLRALNAPPSLGYTQYDAPWEASKGPFVGATWPTELGPVASNRPWMPFAAKNNSPAALPLPLTISSLTLGFKFSIPPVYNRGGHKYWPTLPEKGVQHAAQYIGNAQDDFRVAPATKNGDVYVPAIFEVPSDPAVPFTRLEGFSDWAATTSLTNKAGQSLAITFATGSPLAFVTFDDKTDFGCLSLSQLPPEMTALPVRSWYPEGYKCRTPAGVSIQITGADKYDQDDPLTLKVDIRIGSNTDHQTYVVHKGDTKEAIAKGLQQCCQSSFLVRAGEVTAAPNNNFGFLLSARNDDVTLKQEDVTIFPTEKYPIVLVKGPQPALPVAPPATASIVGITIRSQYAWTDDQKAPQRVYYASYAFIAPTGGKWVTDRDGHLVCDFTQAKSKTLIVCAMPTLYDSAYEHYDDVGTGAAVFLRRFWTTMQPYAYGCPRHLTNGKDDGTGTLLGPNQGKRFTPLVKTEQGKTTVTTEFHFNLTYPAGQPSNASGTLFCLFPHQWRGYANNPVEIFGRNAPVQPVYWTSVGPLYLSGGGERPDKPAFTTTYVFPGMLAHLPNVAGLKGTESFKVYDYPNPKPSHTTTQTLNSQMMQDAATPVWAADLSQNPIVNAFVPVGPAPQQKFSYSSYDWGKYVGLLADLVPAAKDLNQTNAMNAAIRQLNAQLGQWLSSGLVYADANTPFPPGVERWQKGELKLPTFAGPQGLFSNQQFLFYDQQWSTLIPYPTGYYADTNINDHHFHYGYWLRAAAQLALAQARGDDPDNKAAGTFINNYGATVNLIIKDIANPLRGDTQPVGASAKAFPNGPAMPFMRYLDGYSGHSWASGLTVNIIDQESVSEAMSAWTGVIMWGEVTNDTQIRDLGIWMYTHEMMSFYEYWTDCAQGRQKASSSFPSGSAETVDGQGYDEAMKGGIGLTPHFFCHVFNAYRQMSTYFGWEPVYLAGIQWMPFHGGSLYLNSNDPAIQWTLGWMWKWCYGNSKFLWDNYNNNAPLVSLNQGVADFVGQLTASVNDQDPNKHITQGLRDQFFNIGYNLATLQNEKDAKNRVICKKLSNTQWSVTDFGEKTYTVEQKSPALLNVYGKVGAYRPTLFATTWEPIAWQALATIDPNCDQVFLDQFHLKSADEVWGALAVAVGSSGDPVYAAKGWKPLGGQAVSSNYYWIYNSCGLGVRDANVSADYPFAVKFLGQGWPERNRHAKYVVWNMTGAPKTVTFSDGRKVENVPKYQWVAKTF